MAPANNYVFYGIDGSEIYNYLLQREMRLPSFGMHSPQLNHRSSLVSWVSNACKRFSLQKTTEYLAILLMDHFMDNYVVDEDQLQLLALSCVLISAKHEEKEIDIPRPFDLAMLCRHSYSDSLSMKMELTVLKFLSWSIGFPTVAHFSEFFELSMIDCTDTVNDVKLNQSLLQKSHSIAKKYLLFLMDLTAKDIDYKRYRPSLLSAAIVAVTRSLIELTPVWPTRLCQLTGYNAYQLEEPFHQLIKDYECSKEEENWDDRAAGSPSSGYGSVCSSPAFHLAGEPILE